MVIFRVRDLDNMIYSMQKYLMLDFATSGTVEFISSHPLPIVLIVVFWIIHYIMYKIPDFIERISSIRLGYWGMFFLGIVLLIILFYNGDAREFYYFQF